MSNNDESIELKLANLWRSPSLGKDPNLYYANSNVMISQMGRWDGYKDISESSNYARRNVFSEWVEYLTSCFFKNELDYAANKDLLSRMKLDVSWWVLKKGDAGYLDQMKAMFSVPIKLSKVIEDNPDLYEGWCSMWLDVGLIKDTNMLKTFLLKSILANNVNIVSRLIKEYRLDINQNIDAAFVLGNNFPSYLCFDENYGLDTKYNHKVSFGFFVRSEVMAKTLTDFGFNWDIVVCDNVPLFGVIQKKSSGISSDRAFLSVAERRKVIKFVNDKSPTVLANITPEDRLGYTLLFANRKEDVELALEGVSCNAVHGRNGENVLHVLAKNTPHFFKEYIEREDLRKLLGVPDNDGRYPIEYFLCFSDSLASEEDMNMMISATKKYGHIEPDWLEVKMLIAENNATYSAVDSAPINIWKQKTPEDFKDCLKTERGLKLMEMAANNFQYPKDEGAYVYYGMCIFKYLYPDEKVIDFSKVAKTKNEVKLYLRQSWHTLDDLAPYSSNDEVTKIRKTISILTKRAMSLGISVTGMKKDVLENHAEAEAFDETMRMHFNGDEWGTLEIAEERYRLKSVTENSYNNTENKSFECGAAL